MNDVLLNKKVSIERCIEQTGKYYAMPSATAFAEDYLKQDAIAMNLQRISELSIDIANYLIKKKKLGLPQNSADAFALLRRAGLISDECMKSLQGIVDFRKVLAHKYQKLDMDNMINVIERHLHEPLAFADLALQLAEQNENNRS